MLPCGPPGPWGHVSFLEPAASGGGCLGVGPLGCLHHQAAPFLKKPPEGC